MYFMPYQYLHLIYQYYLSPFRMLGILPLQCPTSLETIMKITFPEFTFYHHISSFIVNDDTILFSDIKLHEWQTQFEFQNERRTFLWARIISTKSTIGQQFKNCLWQCKENGYIKYEVTTLPVQQMAWW